MNTVILFFAWK